MAKRVVQPSIDVEAVVAHVFSATTADSFMGLRLGMKASDVTRVIRGKGAWREEVQAVVWERPGPCTLTERIDAMFAPGASARSRGDLAALMLVLSSRDPAAAKPVRALVKALRTELGRRFTPIKDKSTFRFSANGRVNVLWVGGGATDDAAGTGPLAHAKITLGDSY